MAIEAADVAEGVEAVVVDPVVGLFASDEQTCEREIAIELVACGVGFDDGAVLGAVPVELVGDKRGAAGLFDALAITVVEVGLSGGGGEMIFGVVGILEIPRLRDDEVSRRVVGVANDLVLGVHGEAEIFLGAASVQGGDGTDGEKVAPRIVTELFAPAALNANGVALIGWLICRASFCSSYAI